MERWAERIDGPIFWCVGALFEYYSGVRNRAPRWMRRVGLEWLFRLILEPRRLWKRYLLGNAVFSTLSGLTFALAAEAVAGFIGLDQVALVRAAGLGLLGFAGFVAYVATRPAIDLQAAFSIVIGDLSWVVATVPILMFDVLSSNGMVAALAIADIVLLFAGLQYYGIRRIKGSPRSSGAFSLRTLPRPTQRSVYSISVASSICRLPGGFW